jgi:hypothetical protein
MPAALICWVCHKAVVSFDDNEQPIRLVYGDGGTEDLWRHGACEKPEGYYERLTSIAQSGTKHGGGVYIAPKETG